MVEDIRFNKPQPEQLYAQDMSIIRRPDMDSSDPLAIVANTYRLLDLRFYHGQIDKTVTSFLTDYAIPFFAQGAKVIPIKFPRVDIKTSSDQKTVSDFINAPLDQDPQTGLSNLDVIATIFGAMPDMFTLPIPVLSDGFSRRGMLKPPETVSEMQDRITEIQAVLTRIARGKHIKGKKLDFNSANFRMYVFFKVGNDLKLHQPSNKTAMAESNEHQTYSRVITMLEGVEIDLYPIPPEIKKKQEERAAFNSMFSWLDIPKDI